MEYTELKINLMQQGAVFTQEAKSRMCRNRFGHFTFKDYATTGGVVMQINDRFYANVPPKFENTPFCIDFAEDRFVLKYDDNILAKNITIIPVPQYALENTLLDGAIPVRELVMIHADRMRISPIHGCAYHCQFCTCNNQRYMEIPIDKLDRAVQVALKDPNNAPRHILISGGTPREEKDSFEYLNAVYRFFPDKYAEFEFDVMLSPRGRHSIRPDKDGYIDFLKYLHDDCRISTMSINLELYNEELRREFIPDKWEIGKENYLLFIEEAVGIFGEGKVRSSLIAGLEEKEDTLQGVKELADCGCIPVLSAFVPAQGTFMERYSKPEADFLLDIVHEAAHIAHSKGTILGPLCRPCTHNSLTEEKGSVETESN